MREFFSFDREDFTDLVIDTIHSDKLRRDIGAYVADREDQSALLGSICDEVMDAFNDFLDDRREIVFSDGGTGRTVLPTKAIIPFMAGVYGEKAAAEYCRMRAFELLASRADHPVRERAVEYLDIAAGLSKGTGKP